MGRSISVCWALLAALSVQAMPLGLRTAVWSVSAANGKSGVERILPAECEETQLAEVMGAFADFLCGGYVTNREAYAEFRDWALESGARAEALLGSPMTWKSFAMGASSLAAEPVDGDLAIDEVSVGSGGALDAVFSLDGVEIGSAAAEARLKTVFGVEGAATLDAKAFSDRNIGLSLAPTGDGRVRATVTPPSGAGRSFFLRVKVK